MSDDINKKDIKMEAAIIYDSHLPDALRQALEYAGDDGFVAAIRWFRTPGVSARRTPD